MQIDLFCGFGDFVKLPIFTIRYLTLAKMESNTLNLRMRQNYEKC